MAETSCYPRIGQSYMGFYHAYDLLKVISHTEFADVWRQGLSSRGSQKWAESIGKESSIILETCEFWCDLPVHPCNFIKTVVLCFYIRYYPLTLQANRTAFIKPITPERFSKSVLHFLNDYCKAVSCDLKLGNSRYSRIRELILIE